MRPPLNVASDATAPPEAARWRLAAGLVVVFLVVFWVQGRMGPTPSAAPAPAAARGDAVLVVRQPGAEDATYRAPIAPGATVAEATRAALPSRWRGAGEMALLEELGGVASRPEEGLFWQFEVNGAYATRGAGATRLSPGDRVLWKLAPYE